MAILPKNLEKMARGAYGKELSKFLAETILELNSLDDIDFRNKEKAAIEGLARTLAIKKLTDILSPLLLSREEGDRIKGVDGNDDYSLTIKGK